MTFLSNLFFSVILAVQGFFGYGHPLMTMNSTPTADEGNLNVGSQVDNSMPETSHLAQTVSTQPSKSTPNANIPTSINDTPTNTTSIPKGIDNSLTLSLSQATTTNSSAFLSWTTNIPANSKVFLTPADTSIGTKVYDSSSGYSTQGFVNIFNLVPNNLYYYTIEATNETQVKKLTGVFNTKLSSTTFTVPTVSISLATNSLKGDISGGVHGVKWASFSVIANDEPVKINNLNILVSTSISHEGLANGSVFFNGVQISPTKNFNEGDTNIIASQSAITIPANRLSTIDIYADAQTSDSVKLQTGDVVTISLNNNDINNGLGEVSHQNITFPRSVVSGNAITIGQ